MNSIEPTAAVYKFMTSSCVTLNEARYFQMTESSLPRPSSHYTGTPTVHIQGKSPYNEMMFSLLMLHGTAF